MFLPSLGKHNAENCMGSTAGFIHVCGSNCPVMKRKQEQYSMVIAQLLSDVNLLRPLQGCEFAVYLI